MIECGTWETGDEIRITYPRAQRTLYNKKDPKCVYPQFQRQLGIAKRGNFIEMVATKHFEDLGYKVESYYMRLERTKQSTLQNP
jgi:hypothetical protein